MRIPVPTNRLVALALLGALLTAVVAVGLAVPLDGLTGSAADQLVQSEPAASETSSQAAADVPTPNPNFTPAVQTQSGSDQADAQAQASSAQAGHEENEREEEGEHEEVGEHEEYEEGE